MAAVKEITLPYIGDFKDVDVIEVLIKPGDTVKREDSLITLESDKASMEVPAPESGVVKEVKVRVGDKVSEGSPLLSLQVADEASVAAIQPKDAPPRAAAETIHKASLIERAAETLGKVPLFEPALEEAEPSPPAAQRVPTVPAPSPPPTAGLAPVDEIAFREAHATPAVRQFARELGVDLGQVQGRGPKGRILKEDLQAFVKGALSAPVMPPAGFVLPKMPVIDFAQFGQIEIKPLSRIKKQSGANLHRSWITVPHVTHHEAADITELEAFRKAQVQEARNRGIRLTLLAFLMKASVAALKRYPEFNASLDPAHENLMLKHYYHIGVAVDTSEGLVVPVIRDVERKGLFDLAAELSEVSTRAREKKLKPEEMRGGCFSISNLGGIGGMLFTPIINAPEVAILGISRAEIRPQYRDAEFVPRLMLPLSLSYDHRVIDGAAAARFMTYLSTLLADIRRLLF
jgi:Pyruvate/2-oxoglutarate dehydrogenase complex, dihydrolipoamide acyltransferase (E2) component, and related enzymes